MSDILSQSEIDNLLKQLSEGDLDVDQIQGEDEKQVKNYDFSRPTKFSKEHLRTLEIIFEHYSRLISTTFRYICARMYRLLWQVRKRLLSVSSPTHFRIRRCLELLICTTQRQYYYRDCNHLCYAMLDRMREAAAKPLEKSEIFPI